MPPSNQPNFRSSSVYSNDNLDSISTTSSQWTTTYRKLPKKQKQPLSMRFLSWAAGAPRNATVVKKKTRDIPDDRSTYSGWSSGSYFSEPDTQLYWVTSSDDRSYYSGSSSSGSSSSGRSGRSSRKGGGSRRKHFNGAVPNPMPPPPPGGFGPPMDGHFVPPPPPGDMGGEFGGGEFDGGFNPHPMGMGMPPPPPPPMNAPGGGPGFINLTGQNHFHGGPPGGGGFHGAEVEDDGWSDED
ncbi:hypothetical protein QQX98_011225 [Neonectria punicea]|uniref:Uncharacterized protein n=1 Tax=Neonectria punicea TaxID=979145 RepID=A0ABR1GMR2_9HYPO